VCVSVCLLSGRGERPGLAGLSLSASTPSVNQIDFLAALLFVNASVFCGLQDSQEFSSVVMQGQKSPSLFLYLPFV